MCRRQNEHSHNGQTPTLLVGILRCRGSRTGPLFPLDIHTLWWLNRKACRLCTVVDFGQSGAGATYLLTRAKRGRSYERRFNDWLTRSNTLGRNLPHRLALPNFSAMRKVAPNQTFHTSVAVGNGGQSEPYRRVAASCHTFDFQPIAYCSKSPTKTHIIIHKEL